jgi:hypothetical protein
VANIKIKPLTIVLALLGVVLIVVGIVYVSRSAGELPSFFPGHEAGSTHKHIKHGLAAFALGIVAFVGAWLTTAPRRAESR